MIRCPFCRKDAKCIESRSRKLDGAKRRRYECVCGKRFSTLEMLAEQKVVEVSRLIVDTPKGAVIRRMMQRELGLA